MSSTDDLCVETQDYNTLNSDNRKGEKRNKSKRGDSSGSNSLNSSQVEVDEDVQEEIEDLLENVVDIRNNFTVLNKIGSGTFSSVYVAKLKHIDVKQMFALKYLIPTSHPSRIENELKCLQQIGGVDNVMGVKACLRQRDHIVIVMPYFPHERFQDYVWSISVSEVRQYMKALLVALRRVHSVDIIHRDVKPSNFLYNSKIKQYALVDFGLAQKAPVIANTTSNESTFDERPDSKATSGKSLDSRHDCDTSRKTRSSEQQATKNQKRKHSDNPVESSPKKKKANSSEQPSQHSPQQTNGSKSNKQKQLTEIDMNIPQSKPATRASDSSKILKSPETADEKEPVITAAVAAVTDQKQEAEIENLPKSLFNNNTTKDKSMSKNLLKKRAFETLDSQKATIQLAAPGASAEKLGKQQQRSTVVVSQGGKQMYRSVATATCDCYGKPQICTMCMSRSSQHAPRAGTPGFRAPEVLLKCPDQSTAVDIWSAGVIFLSLLTGRYPFFKAPDDITALAQIIALFGTKKVQEAALSMGKNLICSPEQPGLDLKHVCYKLRGIPEGETDNGNDSTKTGVHASKNDSEKPVSSKRRHALPGDWDKVPDSAFDLLEKLLEIDPVKRYSADEALNHSYFTSKTKCS